MVEGSELAFRMLTRRYGVQLAYSPMINARLAADSIAYLERVFTTVAADRPLIAQFAGHDPEALLTAARRVQDRVDAVDLNLGCPQQIARRGRYGAFLLEDTDTVVTCISRLAAELTVPVTAKIRILPTWEDTIRTVLAIQAAGASAITVHGRTRTNMKQAITAADWGIIARIKAHPDVRVPIIANGSVGCLEDAHACLASTGADAVMASEGLLENPGLFTNQIHLPSGARHDVIDMAREYLACVGEYGCDGGDMRGHLMRMLFGLLNTHTDMRDALVSRKGTSAPQALEVVESLDKLVPRLPGWAIEEAAAADSGQAWKGSGGGDGASAAAASHSVSAAVITPLAAVAVDVAAMAAAGAGYGGDGEMNGLVAAEVPATRAVGMKSTALQAAGPDGAPAGSVDDDDGAVSRTAKRRRIEADGSAASDSAARAGGGGEVVGEEGDSEEEEGGAGAGGAAAPRKGTPGFRSIRKADRKRNPKPGPTLLCDTAALTPGFVHGLWCEWLAARGLRGGVDGARVVVAEGLGGAHPLYHVSLREPGRWYERYRKSGGAGGGSGGDEGAGGGGASGGACYG